MSSDVTCGKLREIGAELALGVLPGRERVGAVAHLDGCADCRDYVGQLILVGDGLIGLLPGSEPPVGFETRVAQAISGAPAHEGRPHARATGLPHQSVRGRLQLRIAALVAVLALAVGFGGWAVGTAIEDVTAGPSHSAVANMLWGRLTSTEAVGKPVGEIFAHAGSPGWISISVDLSDAGTPYSGRVSRLLERSDGTTVRVGTFILYKGYGH
ncbi:hypothetical protein [Streptomyces sp. NBC_01615]|uniref:hypothetical protein n=1 Tax=Streptomyces sp. NBC_01615 TaxID=2975898 RepID=UPI0038640D12